MKEKKQSYYRGDSTEPLKSDTIGQTIEQAAHEHANETAILIHGGQRLTYAQVLEKIDTLAAALINLGLKRGDHVAIWGFNTIEWYLSFLAAFRAGIVVVNLNPLFESPEVLACLNAGDVKAVIMDEQHNGRNFYDILKKAIPNIQEHDYNTHITTKHAPLLKTVVMFSETTYKGVFRWRDLFATVTKDQLQNIRNTQQEISPFDICNIQFTSGTTGKPKGVLLRHHGIVNNARFVGNRLELFKKKGQILCQVPFFHAYGMVVGVFASIVTGSTIVVVSVKFSPNKSVDSIITDKCTVVYGTPTMFIDLITIVKNRSQNDPQIYKKISSVERFFSSGALILPDTIVEMKKLFKNAKFSVYGVSDARLGEKVAAAIIKTEKSNLSESDVKQYCEGSIASYKIPEHIHFCEKYPKTASGKIQKVKLREMTEKSSRTKY